MAHSSWKAFNSFRTSRTDDHDELLFMLDEIPTDNESTTEEEPDSEQIIPVSYTHLTLPTNREV